MYDVAGVVYEFAEFSIAGQPVLNAHAFLSSS